MTPKKSSPDGLAFSGPPHAPSGAPTRAPAPRWPLAPVLFFLGLGLLLLSWLGFMGYYVLVKARDPKPVPEVWAPAGTTPHSAPTNAPNPSAQ